MKFYVHHEEKPEATIVIQWPENKSGCIKDVLQIFINSSSDDLKAKLREGNSIITLLNSKREEIQLGANPLAVIQNKEDIYVTLQTGIQNVSKVKRLEKDLSELSLTKEVQLSRRVKELLLEARVHKEGNMYHLAVAAYKDVLSIQEKNKEALHALAWLYLQANRPKEAKTFAQKGVKLFDEDMDFTVDMAEVFLQSKDASSAMEFVMKSCKERRKVKGLEGQDKWRLQCLLARTYVLQNERDMAIVIYQGVLRENSEYLDAAVGLAPLVYDLNDEYFRESIKVLLAALPKRRGDRQLKENLVRISKLPGGMNNLQISMKSAWKTASAVFYVACVFRESGGTGQAIELMDRCLELEPQDPQINLTLAHMHEGKCNYIRAVKVLCEFLSQQSGCNLNEALSIMVKVVVDLLQTLHDSIYMWNPPSRLPEEAPPALGQGHVFQKEELYIVAILFTVMKILFVNGAVSTLPYMASLLDPLHEDKNLHKTDIRNEAAYFHCISKIVRNGQIETPSTDRRFIYHLGDSHCLTSAWRCIMYLGTEHMIHPILSTGTKIWHLRPESVFYPKENFQTAIKRIPAAATVIINLGEIDCREGLMQCVYKCRYENIDEAIKSLLDIYMDLLGQLHNDHRWKIFVHPVPPVLAVTRNVVDKFNEALKLRLHNHPYLSYLNIVDSLLNEDKTTLRDEYEFDNTHLHPSYTKLLELAMNQIVS